MVHATDALRGHIDLARIRFRIGDELGHRLDRHRWSDLHYRRNTKNACNWLNVSDEVEIKFVVKGCIKCVCMGDPEKRVPVSRSMRDRFSSDISTGTSPIFYGKRLTEPFRQPLGNQPGCQIR